MSFEQKRLEYIRKFRQMREAKRRRIEGIYELIGEHLEKKKQVARRF